MHIRCRATAIYECGELKFFYSESPRLFTVKHYGVRRVMTKGFVSVVIPSKNRPDFLHEALGSVFAQTYQNLEVIVVDDGSASSLEPMLKEKYGDRILFLRHEESLGASAARNAGARLASGEYIAFLDDDDLWMPEKIEKQIAAYGELSENFGVVYCGFDYIVNGAIVSRVNDYKKTDMLFPQSLASCPVGSPTALIRKKYFDQVGGYDEELTACEDWDLWVRLSKICLFCPVEEVLALYRVHGAQLSVDLSKNLCFRYGFVDRYVDDLCLYPEILSSHYNRLGSLCRLAGRDKEALSFYVKSIKKNFFNFYAWTHILLSFISISVDRRLTEKYGTKKIGGVRIID